MIKKFEDYLFKVKKENDILKFGEYRKGSSEFGPFIQDLMMFLRNFKNQGDDNLIFKTEDVKFDINKLYELSKSENKNRLISFDFKFLDNNKKEVDSPVKNGYVVFYDLNNKESRPWENLDINDQ
ncbi:MAG: hypothetical protein KC550_07590 [Nanoarchaeota archaeon]|nr:hypothetical protein [Nanoarchaeota archaeon]